MTGLAPDHCYIIEIATLVTDSDLNIIAEGPEYVIHQGEPELATLSDWSRNFFTRSGLIEEVRASRISQDEAERQTLAFLRKHVKEGKSPLCGNSIHHDRAFLYHHMPELHDFAHYRNIDVSTVKELAMRWFPGRALPPRKDERHRAMADIKEAVLELRHYRRHFFSDPGF